MNCLLMKIQVIEYCEITKFILIKNTIKNVENFIVTHFQKICIANKSKLKMPKHREKLAVKYK